MKKKFLQFGLLLTLGVLLSSNLSAQKLKSIRAEKTFKQSVPKAEILGKNLGDDCTNPYLIEVASIPYTYTDAQENGTCGHGNSYQDEVLGYYGTGEDVVYKLQVPQDAQANISLTGVADNEGSFWHAIAIYEGCPDSGILIAHNTTGVFDETVTISKSLEANTEYYILIDYWALDAGICLPSYSLSVEFTTDIFYTYNLYVADVQVDQANATNLSEIEGVNGTVTYDHATKTLTLDNATINGGICIKNTGIENLKIKLIGSNTISSTYVLGTCIQSFKPTEIMSESGGSLKATSAKNTGIYMYKAPLSIKNCTVETSAESWGIAGEATSDDQLSIENATVKATGPKKGSIADITNLTLTDCAITAPEGAYFNEDLNGVAVGEDLVKKQVIIAPTTATKDVQQANISLYPNPVKDILNITTNTNSFKVEIFNALGKLISVHTNKNKISTAKLPSGIYMLKITTSEGLYTQKFIKK